MKKTIVNLALIAIVTITTASCKKEYECHCDKVGGGDEHMDIKAKKEADAKSECEAKAPSSTYSKCHLE